MKNIQLYIIASILSIFLYTSVFADQCSNSCKIADGPADVLKDYLADVESITQEIVKSISEVDVPKKTSLKSERNRVVAAFNAVLSFGEYFGSFDYWIILPMTHEVPKEVRRDHSKILQMNDKLNRILKKAEKKNVAGAQVKDVCQGIENCNFPGSFDARTILIEILKNNQQIGQLFRASITDKAFTAEAPLILVPANFKSEIESHYNKDTLLSCSKCEDGFAEKTSEMMEKIANLQNSAKDGIQKWKDAWALSQGGEANVGYKEKEAKLLSDFLETQGINDKQSDIIKGNLERYNEKIGAGSSTTNPLQSSVLNSTVQIENELKTFQEIQREKLSESENQKIPYREVIRVDAQLKESEHIEKNIATIFEDQAKFALVEDTKTQKLQAKIIHMHFSLVRSINILDGKVKDVEKICNKPSVGQGKCDNY